MTTKEKVVTGIIILIILAWMFGPAFVTPRATVRTYGKTPADMVGTTRSAAGIFKDKLRKSYAYIYDISHINLNVDKYRADHPEDAVYISCEVKEECNMVVFSNLRHPDPEYFKEAK